MVLAGTMNLGTACSSLPALDLSLVRTRLGGGMQEGDAGGGGRGGGMRGMWEGEVGGGGRTGRQESLFQSVTRKAPWSRENLNYA